MMFGANQLVCSSGLPRECAPFYRARVSPVIVVLIRSVNIVFTGERDDYPTAAEEERILYIVYFPDKIANSKRFRANMVFLDFARMYMQVTVALHIRAVTLCNCGVVEAHSCDELIMKLEW